MDWNKYYEDTLEFIKKSYSVYEHFKKINPDYYTGRVLHWVMKKEAIIGYGVPDYMDEDGKEYEYCDHVIFSFPIKFLDYSEHDLDLYVDSKKDQMCKINWLKSLNEDQLFELVLQRQVIDIK